MENDNSLSVLQQFLVEQSQANDMFHSIVKGNYEGERTARLVEYSKLLIRYLEVKAKYEK